MSTTTVNRVPRNTSEDVNWRIADETEERVRQLAANPAAIHRRLKQLDEEWDIERMLEANAAAIAFAGTVLGIAVNRRWLAVPLLVGGFLFQHALQGWCHQCQFCAVSGFEQHAR
jgi:hypothetical protein